MERHLEWEGCFNVRDLGGLPTRDGRLTHGGALVRSDEPSTLTTAGWAALEAHGVRTVLDLRNDDEVGADLAERPPTVQTVRIPLDDVEDVAFWERTWADELDGTPLYFRPFLEQKPERCAAAVAAIAQAEPGGVLVHCVGGRDRTGLVTLLALALAGAEPNAVAADYGLSNERLPPFWERRGWADQRPELARILERKQTTARELVVELLESVDVERVLVDAGLREDDVTALRARLVGCPLPSPRG
jgi:protein tyrosine/serine phosphatase